MYKRQVIDPLRDEIVETIAAIDPAAGWVPVLFQPLQPNPTAYEISQTTFNPTVRTMHRRTVGLGI